MTIKKLFPAALSALASLSLFPVQGASLPDAKAVPPSARAIITQANYCFARVRRFMPERQPPSYLVLQLRIQVTYRNNGTRPLILPLENERTIYTALKPGVMNIFHELPIFTEIEPTVKMMKELPGKVNPDNPTDPRNDYFEIIPAQGEIVLPDAEDIVLPVNHKLLLRHDPDLRGHKVYIRLQLNHQKLAPTLETDLSDRWTRFGAPWTGDVLTNVMTIDVPQVPPQSPPCVDRQVGTPARSLEIGK
jgi:hypothetical protein